MSVREQRQGERRKAARLDHQVEAEVRLASYMTVMKSVNISRDGLFLRRDNNEQRLLPVQSIVRLVFNDPIQKLPILARIAWVSEEGMGLNFVEPDEDLLNRLISLQS